MNDIVLAWTDVIYDLGEALEDENEPVYVVGGAVRDAILRRPIKDLDIVTPRNGMKLARRIANRFGGDYYALDEEHDAGRAILKLESGRLVVDVTGFRADDLTGDLTNRDFTVNAIAVDLKSDLKTLIDPLDGASDLLGKRLRRCSPESLTQDPIRILRGIRQSVQLGLRIEPETLRDMKASASRLSETSPERVRDELVKLLSLTKVTSALRVADTLGVLKIVLPELDSQHNLTQSPPHLYDVWNHTLAVMDALGDILNTFSFTRTDETAAQFNLGMIAISMDRFRTRLQARYDSAWADGRPHRSVLMLAALLHDAGKPMVERAEVKPGKTGFPKHDVVGAEAAYERLTTLKFSNPERKFVTALIRHHMDRAMWSESLTPLEIYRFWRQMGEDGIDLILLTLADYLGATGHAYDQEIWLGLVENAQILLEAYFEKREELVDPPALVNGDSLMEALGLSPGPKIRDLLEHIREGQVTGDIRSFEDAVKSAKTFLNGSHGE